MTFRRSTLNRLLTHPLALSVKRPLKDALWTARGRALANPQIPARVTSILFVCKGNICRSPFAALLAAQRLAERGVGGVHCSSAGISVTQAARAPQEACEAAALFGLSLLAHVPLQVTGDLLLSHDLTIVMEAGQMQELRRRYPEAASRIVLLPLIDRDQAGYVRFNIADPFGQPLPAFHDCYRRIDRLVTRLLDRVAGHPNLPAKRTAASSGAPL